MHNTPTSMLRAFSSRRRPCKVPELWPSVLHEVKALRRKGHLFWMEPMCSGDPASAWGVELASWRGLSPDVEGVEAIADLLPVARRTSGATCVAPGLATVDTILPRLSPNLNDAAD
jgi:hypothetical protein